MLDLDAIEARAAAATPGPWEARHSRLVGGSDGRDLMWSMDAVEGEGSFVRQEDAKFAAHAREDVPAMAQEVRRLRNALHGLAWDTGNENMLVDFEP